jgi:hypothetical protein
MVYPDNASSVTLHSCLAATRSSSGGGGGPFRLDERPCPWLCPSFRLWPSSDDEPLPASLFSLSVALLESVLLLEPNAVLGKINFFCLPEDGRISSKSTGTPRLTRNSRRMRERTQLDGCNGGGATSWDHKDADLGVRKSEFAGGVEVTTG